MNLSRSLHVFLLEIFDLFYWFLFFKSFLKFTTFKIKSVIMLRLFPCFFQLLEQQEKDGHWETRYFLLLWLSILVLIPFHLSRFDSGAASGGDQTTPATLMSRILGSIKHNLIIGDKCQDASAFLSGKYRESPDSTVFAPPGNRTIPKTLLMGD